MSRYDPYSTGKSGTLALKCASDRAYLFEKRPAYHLAESRSMSSLARMIDRHLSSSPTKYNRDFARVIVTYRSSLSLTLSISSTPQKYKTAASRPLNRCAVSTLIEFGTLSASIDHRRGVGSPPRGSNVDRSTGEWGVIITRSPRERRGELAPMCQLIQQFIQRISYRIGVRAFSQTLEGRT